MEAEIQGYLTELNILREQIRGAVRELSDEGANWHPLPEATNSIYAILAHLMDVDHFWVFQVIGEKDLKHDRDAVFRAFGNLKELLIRWEKSWVEIETTLGKLTPAQLLESSPSPMPARNETLTIQWIILHLISHYAIHLGHIQLTRQLWEQHCR